MTALKACVLVIAAALATSSCGGRPEPPEDLPGTATTIALPEPIAAVPVYRVTLREPLERKGVRRLERIGGVAVVAAIAAQPMRVGSEATDDRLRVGAVDPLTFRSVAPRATMDAEFVWTSLLAGEAVLTPRAADRLRIRGSGNVRLPRLGEVPVGAFASNGTPELADVLIDARVGDKIGLSDPDTLVIGAETGAAVERVRDALKRRLPGARFTRLLAESSTRPASAPQPVGQATGGFIGTMRFRILRDGFIEPEPSWVATNISTQSVPILGAVTCHRVLFPQLAAALQEVRDEGLARLIDPGQYGGCYAPRFIDRDPGKPLSLHAFGLAIDLNVRENPLGSRGRMDARLVAIFEKWGFYWGGRFDRPDPMHFELSRLMRV